MKFASVRRFNTNTLLALQSRTAYDISDTTNTPESDYGRSCAVVEKFIDFHEKRVPCQDSENMSNPQIPTYTTPGISAMKAAAARHDLSEPISQSLNSNTSSLGVPGSLGSLSGASILSTSPEPSRKPERQGPGPQCAKCHKTFSSVSNRNKHNREGCTYRDRKGYKCRNEHCPKVLSTKWYRNDHELRKCRFG